MTDEKPSGNNQDTGYAATDAEKEMSEVASSGKGGILSEFFHYLMKNKKWWLTPIIVVLLLLSVLLILAGSGAAPFIYTLF